jgi:hypothetical protein
VWHFAELEGLSVQASLLKSVITISISGVDLRWQTLKRGANEVASVWSDWRQIGSALAQYPEFEVEIVSIESSQVLKCKKCRCPITIEKVDQDSMRKRCGACYSLHTLNY